MVVLTWDILHVKWWETEKRKKETENALRSMRCIYDIYKFALVA